MSFITIPLILIFSSFLSFIPLRQKKDFHDLSLHHAFFQCVLAFRLKCHARIIPQCSSFLRRHHYVMEQTSSYLHQELNYHCSPQKKECRCQFSLTLLKDKQKQSFSWSSFFQG